MYKTRIAPSPTGDMHLGTARTAYFNYLAARGSGGTFALRIDDTDLVRSKQEHVDVILRTMEFLGLEYDTITYQSHRFDAYKDYAADLIAAKVAEEKDGAIVLSHELDQPKGPVQLVLIKGDGSPSYHFASVLDDWMDDTSYIIRGVDHESNEVKHRLIWDTLNGVKASDAKHFPKLDHVGLIHMNKKKMSKRDGASSMLKYEGEGYSPDALLNFMLRMGWGPKEDNKANSIIPKDRAIQMFLTEGSMKKSAANFDQAKLDWFNKKYRGMQNAA